MAVHRERLESMVRNTTAATMESYRAMRAMIDDILRAVDSKQQHVLSVPQLQFFGFLPSARDLKSLESRRGVVALSFPAPPSCA